MCTKWSRWRCWCWWFYFCSCSFCCSVDWQFSTAKTTIWTHSDCQLDDWLFSLDWGWLHEWILLNRTRSNGAADICNYYTKPNQIITLIVLIFPNGNVLQAWSIMRRCCTCRQTNGRMDTWVRWSFIRE